MSAVFHVWTSHFSHGTFDPEMGRTQASVPALTLDDPLSRIESRGTCRRAEEWMRQKRKSWQSEQGIKENMFEGTESRTGKGYGNWCTLSGSRHRGLSCHVTTRKKSIQKFAPMFLVCWLLFLFVIYIFIPLSLLVPLIQCGAVFAFYSITDYNTCDAFSCSNSG